MNLFQQQTLLMGSPLVSTNGRRLLTTYPTQNMAGTPVQSSNPNYPSSLLQPTGGVTAQWPTVYTGYTAAGPNQQFINPGMPSAPPPSSIGSTPNSSQSSSLQINNTRR